jgi:hypothetical protein
MGVGFHGMSADDFWWKRDFSRRAIQSQMSARSATGACV